MPAFSGFSKIFINAFGFRLAGFDAEQQQADLLFQRLGILDIRAVVRMQFFDQLLGFRQKAVAQLLLRADERLHRGFHCAYCSSNVCIDGPLMMSGVRASSMRMESTSSTMAK